MDQNIQVYLHGKTSSVISTDRSVGGKSAGNDASDNSVPVKDFVTNGPNATLACITCADVKFRLKRRLPMPMTDQVSVDNGWPRGGEGGAF